MQIWCQKSRGIHTLVYKIDYYHKPHTAREKEVFTALFLIISFLLSNQTIWHWYSNNQSHWEDSFEYPQHMARGSNKVFRSCKMPLFLSFETHTRYVTSHCMDWIYILSRTPNFATYLGTFSLHFVFTFFRPKYMETPFILFPNITTFSQIYGNLMNERTIIE